MSDMICGWRGDQGPWAPENNDGSEGHPEASSILPCISHILLLAYLPQADCCDRPNLLATFNCTLCARGQPHVDCSPTYLHFLALCLAQSG